MVNFKVIFSFVFAFLLKVNAQTLEVITLQEKDISTGADQTAKYLPLLNGKRVAVVANTTSLISKTHLVDSLKALKIDVKKVFAPEHGFRGTGDAGEKLNNSKDAKTGINIISLYGKNSKPKPEDLKDIDVLLYDIQDVGVRFYTYISTMSYCMEACAENNKQMIILDRPNPNGFYVDGPVLDLKWKSFLGLHPVPIVYGMTCGEYGLMLNGEGWLANKVKCKLEVIPVIGYSHKNSYELPVKPSPNLPNSASVFLYPSLGLFEGTIISVGRGTDFPFQVIGHPELKKGTFSFTPAPKAGSKSPKYEGKLCKGYDLRLFGKEVVSISRQIYLFWLMETYKALNKPDFFDENFNFHVGNDELQKQIKENLSETLIRKSWQKGIEDFKKVRKRYLLYPDFE